MADNKEVVKMVSAIFQAAERGYHGARDSEGNDYKTGLRREVEVDVRSSMFDGFKVKVHGDTLTINYQLEMHDTEYYDKVSKLETDVKSTLSKIKTFIKSQYKDITGKSLGLTSNGEPTIKVTPISMVRTSIVGISSFKIAGIEKEESKREESETAKKVLKTLEKTAKKPTNDERKKEESK